jgi:3-dehydroquinate synthase
MSYTATLAYDRGMLSQEEHTRIFNLFSRAGLSIDHPTYDDRVIEMGTAAILKTRDGSLRLAVPSPLGQCQFVNEYTVADLQRVLKVHKEHTARYPRSGAGLEAYVDASDTGETIEVSSKADGHAIGDGHANGTGHANGKGHAIANGHTKGSNGDEKFLKSVLNGTVLNGKKAHVQDGHQENTGIENLVRELANTTLPVEPQVA